MFSYVHSHMLIQVFKRVMWNKVIYRVIHKSLRDSNLSDTVAGMVMAKGSMSAEGETLQVSV